MNSQALTGENGSRKKVKCVKLGNNLLIVEKIAVWTLCTNIFALGEGIGSEKML